MEYVRSGEKGQERDNWELVALTLFFPFSLFSLSLSFPICLFHRWLELISDLLTNHYDSAYRRSLRANRSNTTQNQILPLILQNCSQEEYRRAAEEILSHRDDVNNHL